MPSISAGQPSVGASVAASTASDASVAAYLQSGSRTSTQSPKRLELLHHMYPVLHSVKHGRVSPTLHFYALPASAIGTVDPLLYVLDVNIVRVAIKRPVATTLRMGETPNPNPSRYITDPQLVSDCSPCQHSAPSTKASALPSRARPPVSESERDAARFP